METFKPPSQQSQEDTHPANWGIIDARGLKALIKAAVPMALLEARTDEWFDHTLIVSAQRLPLDASSDTVKKSSPTKINSLRLVEEGHTYVIDYHEGIREWISQQNPIQ